MPLALLVALLALSVYLFGDASSAGANQIVLLVCAGAGALIGLWNGQSWRELEQGVISGIAIALKALLILLVVGALMGTWMLGGVVPTMIDYGLSLLTPRWFYAAACAICGLVSLATGSSWTTAGTVGVALVGVATAGGLHPGLTAGAIISGAYFGDKMSPLSDTTNLAPAMTGTDLFVHIRYMTWTTVPSILLALGGFIIAGVTLVAPQNGGAVQEIQAGLAQAFVLDWYLLSPLLLVLVLVANRMPALPALAIGTVAGGVCAVLFQPEAVLTFVAQPGLPIPLALAKGVWISSFDGFVLGSGNVALDELLSRGGMSSMLPTVLLIVSAMAFGAIMETTGLLQRLAEAVLHLVRGTGSLVAATLATAIGTNVLASDQYIAIVLPGRMFRAEYERRGLDPKLLSRSVEDAGTLTSPLVPWNTCGAFMAQTLGVATVSYLPFAFFNLINPLVALLFGVTGVSITRVARTQSSDGGRASA